MKRLLVIAILTLAVQGSMSAQELVHNFINPSFVGGNWYNASWLLQQATAQNTFSEATTDDLSLFGSNTLDDFTDSVNRQVLNQISKNLFSDTFGEDGLKEGVYEIGDFTIDVRETLEGININIVDNVEGGETNILVPFF